jgi:hypothetical protein
LLLCIFLFLEAHSYVMHKNLFLNPLFEASKKFKFVAGMHKINDILFIPINCLKCIVCAEFYKIRTIFLLFFQNLVFCVFDAVMPFCIEWDEL